MLSGPCVGLRFVVPLALRFGFPNSSLVAVAIHAMATPGSEGVSVAATTLPGFRVAVGMDTLHSAPPSAFRSISVLQSRHRAALGMKGDPSDLGPRMYSTAVLECLQAMNPWGRGLEPARPKEKEKQALVWPVGPKACPTFFGGILPSFGVKTGTRLAKVCVIKKVDGGASFFGR